MSEIFKKQFKARWADMDYNGHMANTAYLDLAGDVRMLYFEENGFFMKNFAELHMGPVVFKDEIEYFKEVRLMENIEVHHLIAGYSEDGSKFRIRNIFYRSDGKKAASITSTGGWLDLKARKLVLPPQKLFNAFKQLVKADDFEILPNRS